MKLKPETIYGYRKTIQDLTRENANLSYERQIYRNICLKIFETACDLIQDGKNINLVWIIKQIREALR